MCELGILAAVFTIRANTETLGIGKHVLQKLTPRRMRARVGKLHGLFDLIIDLFLDGLQLGLARQVVLEDVLLQGRDGISCGIVSFLICSKGKIRTKCKLCGIIKDEKNEGLSFFALNMIFRGVCLKSFDCKCCNKYLPAES